MKTYWGVSALNHDASIAVIRGNEILFAAHSERYSGIKNDQHLNYQIVSEALMYGQPDEIVWFEKPLLKKTRQLYAGQWKQLSSVLPRSYLDEFSITAPISYVSHHMSHAAAGYYTSGFNDASIIVVDAIGEWDTISIWSAENDKLKKVHSCTYPNSIGLLYSAMTDRIGLKANEEEYILMGMAAYGNPIYCNDIKNDFIEEMRDSTLVLKENTHIGIRWWKPELTTNQEYMNIAASIQAIVEDFMMGIATYTRKISQSRNLILMGGVALNCVANEKIARLGMFDNIWIMPNPGDAGSSIGAAAAKINRKLNWQHPYLGTNIDRPLDPIKVVDAILNHRIIGIANGRAEFGPRALGNRSLIADPRGPTIKDEVNNIKKRQQFRPFAPIVMEEYAHKYFDMPVKISPYMQFTAQCLHPELFPAICHVNGSSRVQTLNRKQNPVIYAVLEEFYARTGCPILLNTSLNIKGEPLVNVWEDALKFQKLHNIPIF